MRVCKTLRTDFYIMQQRILIILEILTLTVVFIIKKHAWIEPNVAELSYEFQSFPRFIGARKHCGCNILFDCSPYVVIHLDCALEIRIRQRTSDGSRPRQHHQNFSFASMGKWQCLTSPGSQVVWERGHSPFSFWRVESIYRRQDAFVKFI